MKAKDYVNKFHEYQIRFQDNPSFKGEIGRDVAAGMEIIQDLIGEVNSILEKRGGNLTLISGIFKEQRIKWLAIVRILKNPNIQDELYDFAIAHQFPELKALKELNR